MAIIVPNTGSTYASAGSIPNSCNHWAWLGFTATPGPGASGSMMWYRDSASTSGSELLPIVCASGAMTFLTPIPFNSPNGLFAASISGGCAIVWMKAAS